MKSRLPRAASAAGLAALVAALGCSLRLPGGDSWPRDSSADGDVDGDADEGPVERDGDAPRIDGDGDADADVTDGRDADIVDAEAEPNCTGSSVGGFCWHASAVNESCDETCMPWGGCVIEGTRDYAGSLGTDEHCLAVLEALGYGSFTHTPSSNNDLGCHVAWVNQSYWSQALPTTCAASHPGAPAAAIRMCACAR